MTLKDKKTIKMNVVDTISVLCTQSSFLAREYSHRDSRIWEKAVTVRWEGGSQGYLRSLLQDILSICQHTTDQMWRAHEAVFHFPQKWRNTNDYSNWDIKRDKRAKNYKGSCKCDPSQTLFITLQKKKYQEVERWYVQRQSACRKWRPRWNGIDTQKG